MNPRRPKPPPTLPEFPPGAMVTAVQVSGRDPEWRAVKVNRKHVATIAAAEVAALGLAPGTPYTEDLGERLLALEAKAKGRRYAMNVLTTRMLSRGELVHKLGRRHVRTPDAEAIADDMARVGLLDDLVFARGYVAAQLARKPAGRTLLAAKLRQKRVEPAAARRAVDEALKTEDLPDQAYELAKRRARAMPPRLEPAAVQRRLYGMLARRGFDPDACRSAVDRVMKGKGEEAD